MEESSAEERWLIGKPAGVFASCLPRSEQAEQFAWALSHNPPH